MNHSGTLGKRYFYVPKATKEIRYIAESGHVTYNMEVRDPEGVAVQVVDDGGEQHVGAQQRQCRADRLA